MHISSLQIQSLLPFCISSIMKTTILWLVALLLLLSQQQHQPQAFLFLMPSSVTTTTITTTTKCTARRTRTQRRRTTTSSCMVSQSSSSRSGSSSNFLKNPPPPPQPPQPQPQPHIVTDNIGASSEDENKIPTELKSSPLSLSMEELAHAVGGHGRASILWDCLRQGKEPLDDPTLWQVVTENDNDDEDARGSTTNLGDRTAATTSLGRKAKKKYQQNFGRIEESIAKLVVCTTAGGEMMKVSSDGTTKLLLQLQRDGLQVEIVLIPFPDRQQTTLCVSSQVGCRQACTFCETGRMGRLRNLSADEILSQVWIAQDIISQQHCQRQRDQGMMYPISNIVFMGMGEPADNIPAVVRAVQVLTDAQQFQLAPRRVTVSTVGPRPSVFCELGANAPAVLAWSVHSSRDSTRKQLVPTTQYPMTELRQGLIDALRQRSRRMRALMLEVTLLDGINDSVEDAEHLAHFCKPMLEIPGIKLVINLIPWNPISTETGHAFSRSFRKPSMERVGAFQKALVAMGMRCYVRTTRGDEESAACGQLATTKKKKATA